MKKIATATLLLFLFTACTTKKEGLQRTQNPVISGQLFSYGNNTAISGATIVSRKCTSDDYMYCTRWEQKTSTSAADGSFTVQNDYLNNIQVHSPGYWSYIDEEGFSYITFDRSNIPKGSLQRFYKNGILEKITIELVPEVKVNVHIKNTSAISDSIPVYMVAEGQLGYGITASLIFLRKGIDTTFEYTAFGNLKNRFLMKKGFGWIDMDLTLSVKEVFLAAGNSTSLAINF